MTFPVKIEYPTYYLTLPISKLNITYRPFIEKERKILLMALESGDAKDVMNGIVQILNNCCLTQLPIEDLTTVDVEYFFLQLRAKSIGEIIKLNFRCDNGLDKPCGNIMQVDVDITTTTVTDLKKNEVIRLTPTIAVKMKYPGFRALEDYNDGEEDIGYVYEIIGSCVDYVVNGDDTFYAKDFTKEDMTDFILSLTTEQFNKLQAFIEELPSLTKSVDHTCNRCGYEHKIIISGYQSFFV